MVEPSGHCPYLGLKQNQAIRFASPTPEHRCYATGQAQDIPITRSDYQSALCLSSGHVRCPLYTGSGLPSTPPVIVGTSVGQVAAVGGLRGWFVGLTLRDRRIYIGLLTLLLVIFGIYTVAGVNLLRNSGLLGDGSGISNPPMIVPSTALPSATPSDTATATSTHTPTITRTSTPTATDTSVPTATDIPLPTATDIPLPTATDIPLPTLTNTASPLTPVITDTPWVEPTVGTEPPTAEPPTAEPPTAEPPTAEPPTAEPPTAEPPTAEPPTAEPPTAEPPTAEPPTAEPPTAEPTSPQTFESPIGSAQPEISRTSEPQPLPISKR